MATKAKKQRPPETRDDEFSELGGRNRTVIREEALTHDCGEYIDDGGSKFLEAECRVMLHLEDGRCLNKVFNLRFEEDDVEE